MSKILLVNTPTEYIPSLEGYLIYRAIAPNGKCYIGKTSNLELRIRCHLSKSSNLAIKTKFYRALRKHGAKNFKWEILEKNIPEQLSDEKEIYYIELYDSYKKGYNSTIGGDGGSPMKRAQTLRRNKKKNKRKQLENI